MLSTMVTANPDGAPGEDDAARLAALRSYAVVGTPPEAVFNRLTALAAQLFRVPVALISLADDRRLWFKAHYGTSLQEANRAGSFCTAALNSERVMVIPDALQDDRFSTNAHVVGEPHVRFYAGAPLITPDGHRLGTFCLLDDVPHHEFAGDAQRALQALATGVMEELEARRTRSSRHHAAATNAAILAASVDAVFTLDDQGTVVEWNAAASRLTGYDRQEVLGRFAWTLVAELNGEAVGQAFWAFLQAQPYGVTERFVASIVRRDGTAFTGEVTLLTLVIEGQRTYTLTLRDLTSQEDARLRTELEERHTLLQAVMDSVPELIYVKDLQRRYLMINLAGAAHFSQPVAAILGKTDEQLLPKSTALASRRSDEQVLSSGERLLYEVRARSSDGQVRAFWSSKTTYHDRAGNSVGLIGVSTDITARKAAEAEVRQHNELLSQRIEEAQLEILERLARAAEYRDDDTGEHMIRVGTTAAALARELGFAEAEVALIRQTAPLHDVGKIGIPDSILFKPGCLTQEEFELVRTHSVIGAGILRGGHSPLVKMAETIARTHHEHWDGSGYPNGLVGETIPLVGRIVAVADVFDALISERPYKQAWTVPAALAEIEIHAGRQFDPQVVQALLRLHMAGT